MKKRKIILKAFTVAVYILFVSTSVFSGAAVSPSLQQKSPQGTSATPAQAPSTPAPSAPAPSIPAQVIIR